MPAKISPTSPRGIMPRPISKRSPELDVAKRPAATFPSTPTATRQPAKPKTAGLLELGDIGVDADAHEEDRHEDVDDRSEVTTYSVDLASATERKPCDERADDRRQLRLVGKHGDQQRECDCEREDGAVAARESLHTVEESGCRDDSDGADTEEEQDRDAGDVGDRADTDGALGDDADDDGQDHESEDVIGDCRTEHCPRFGGRQRAQVTEDTRGDADARRGQRGADEEASIAALAERKHHAGARGKRQRDAGKCDLQRTATDRGEFPKVHLHAHFEQEHDHAELGEEVNDVAVADEAERRWPDGDARPVSRRPRPVPRRRSASSAPSFAATSTMRRSSRTSGTETAVVRFPQRDSASIDVHLSALQIASIWRNSEQTVNDAALARCRAAGAVFCSGWPDEVGEPRQPRWLR